MRYLLDRVVQFSNLGYKQDENLLEIAETAAKSSARFKLQIVRVPRFAGITQHWKPAPSYGFGRIKKIP